LNSLKIIRRAYLRRAADRKFIAGNPAAGVARLFKLAALGDPVSSCRLADCHERGVGVVQNFAAAIRWYETAAQLGVIDAMEKLGDIYLYGRVARPATLNSSSDSNRLGRTFRLRDTSISPDPVKAAQWNRRAAEGGAAEAQAKLGFQYVAATGVATNLAEAKKWFLASAEQGSASGQLGLGTLFASGGLGTKDEAAAAHWFGRSAAQGNLQASFALAMLLCDGREIPADYPRAAQLFLDAATAGRTEAMFHLGEIYRRGRPGVDQDLVTAETWLRRACSRGFIPAFMALARLLLDQRSPSDYAGAVAILRQGGELGDPSCQLTLGELFAGGKGVGVDPEQSIAWLRRAGRHGYVSARILCGRSPFGYAAGDGLVKKTPFTLSDLAIMASPATTTELWYGWE